MPRRCHLTTFLKLILLRQLFDTFWQCCGGFHFNWPVNMKLSKCTAELSIVWFQKNIHTHPMEDNWKSRGEGSLSCQTRGVRGFKTKQNKTKTSMEGRREGWILLCLFWKNTLSESECLKEILHLQLYMISKSCQTSTMVKTPAHCAILQRVEDNLIRRSDWSSLT